MSTLEVRDAPTNQVWSREPVPMFYVPASGMHPDVELQRERQRTLCRRREPPSSSRALGLCMGMGTCLHPVVSTDDLHLRSRGKLSTTTRLPATEDGVPW